MKLTTEIVQNAEIAMIDALKNGNVTALEPLFHDQLFFRIPNGQMVGKQDHLEHIKTGDLILSKLTTQNQEIRIIGDNAVVSVVKSIKGSFQRDPFEGKFHYIRVWKWEKNDLKVIGGAGVNV